MASDVDMYSTFCRKAMLPEELREENSDLQYRPEVVEMLNEIKNGGLATKRVLLHGYAQGKTVSACACLREFLKSRRYIVTNDCPGLFVSVHQLCYQNRTVDKYNRDAGLQALIRDACTTDFLILDGLFSYLTQNDDLLLQAIYDKRQHSGKITFVTTEIVDPLNTSSSLLFRIARDAERRVVFNADTITG